MVVETGLKSEPESKSTAKSEPVPVKSPTATPVAGYGAAMPNVQQVETKVYL